MLKTVLGLSLNDKSNIILQQTNKNLIIQFMLLILKKGKMLTLFFKNPIKKSAFR